jgi:hypothetical protein
VEEQQVIIQVQQVTHHQLVLLKEIQEVLEETLLQDQLQVDQEVEVGVELLQQEVIQELQ